MTSVASFLIEIPTTGEEEASVSIVAVAVPVVFIICVVVRLAADTLAIIAVWKCSRRSEKVTPDLKIATPDPINAPLIVTDLEP